MNDVECVSALQQELKASEEKYDALKKDYDRKTYIATGLSALIVQTGDNGLVHKAAEIANDADKLY